MGYATYSAFFAAALAHDIRSCSSYTKKNMNK